MTAELLLSLSCDDAVVEAPCSIEMGAEIESRGAAEVTLVYDGDGTIGIPPNCMS